MFESYQEKYREYLGTSGDVFSGVQSSPQRVFPGPFRRFVEISHFDAPIAAVERANPLPGVWSSMAGYQLTERHRLENSFERLRIISVR